MDIQRLRNLTTGRLHTEMAHVYEDIEFIVGEEGIMTHCIPAAMNALEPYLRAKVADARFWQDEYDIGHVGTFEIGPMGDADRVQFWARFSGRKA